jgi:aspartate racemase
MTGSTIGVVGGLGPDGTVHYYQKLTDRLRGIPHDEGRPGILVDHVWMDRFAPLLLSGLETATISLLGESLERLHRAGADVALIAAVTPHKFISALRRGTSVPVIDVVEATISAVRRARYTRVGLLGSRATLTEPFFRGGLERAGISVRIPAEADVTYLDDLIYGPLALGARNPEMSRRVPEIVRSMAAGARLEALVVACTELIPFVEPLLPVIDPVECHVAFAVNSVRWNVN